MLPKRITEWRQRHPNLDSLIIAGLIALAIRSSVVQAFWVPSGSMLPTIQIGDHLFVNKLAYGVRLDPPFFGGLELLHFSDPERGDVAVFVSPVDGKTDLIKRIVAVAGDTVEIRSKRLLVNGEHVDYSQAFFQDPTHTSQHPRDNFGPVTVPEGKFFVLGDNRDQSHDSRFWGFAEVSDLKGRATFIYWSRNGGWPRLDRFGRFIR